MKNITLLGTLMFIANMAFAQNPCGTVIEFVTAPATVCSSIQYAFPLYATPVGGVYSGAIVSSNGAVLNYAAAAGTYKVYYTAPDTCATVDSFNIEVMATSSEVFFDGSFDCTDNTPVSGFILAGQNEFIDLTYGNQEFAQAQNGGSDNFTQTLGRSVTATITTATGTCDATVATPTTNTPQVSVDISYDCTLDRAYLNYTGPSTRQVVRWRKFNEQGNALERLVDLGAPLLNPSEGLYQMQVFFDNGCETIRNINVPAGAENVVPRIGSSVYSPLSCLNMPIDSFPLLGSSSSNDVRYSWSSIDGSPFPGDSTVQRPMVPGVPGSYIFRAVNLASGCTSRADTSVIVRATGDTTSITANICEGESYAINGQLFTVAGSYQSVEVGTFGCDSLILLDLIVNDLPAVDLTAIGPNAAGEYEVNAFAPSGQVYDYAWCNGATSSLVSGLTSLDCEVTITDPNSGCAIVVNANTATVSSATQAIPGSFAIAPNPVTDFINWSYTGSATLLSTEVHTSTGQLIAKTSVNNALNQRLDLSTVPKGLYTITWMDSDGRRSTRRIIRQ